MISINKVVVDFGGFRLFNEISFLINPSDRIGLIGKNGAGKTTLLKLIAGKQDPSEGSISMPKDFKLGYLPQHMAVDNSRTVFAEVEQAFEELKQLEKEIDQMQHDMTVRTDYESDSYSDFLNSYQDKNDRYHMLGGTSYTSLIEQTLKGLGFERADFDRNTGEFSGGWRMRIELAKILLKRPDAFLLDEPTNHLDIESIQWLEDFLKNYNGAVLLISHDKAFLNGVCNRTIEISLGNVYDYRVAYSKFLELRAERLEQQMAAYTNQQKMIEDTQKFIDRFRYQATKAIMVQSRIKQLERLDVIEVDEVDKSALRIKFPPAPHSGAITIEAKGITKRYDSHLVLDHADLVVERGEKVAFVGRNGEGKSTMAKIIMDQIEYQGQFKLGHQVKIGYFAQNQADLLDEDLTILETIDRIAVGAIRTKIRDLLGAFMFSGETVDKKVKVLSGGERTRLAMVALLLEPSNLLILDEPTNHLDIKSKDLLKQAIIDFEGTVIVVSHDREFLDGLVDKVYEFRNKKIKEHLGGIYEFLHRKKMDSLKELEKVVVNQVVEKTKVATPIVKEPEPVSTSKLTFEERKELNKKIKKAQNSVAKCEDDIARIEREIEVLGALLHGPEGSDMSIINEYDAKKKKLNQVMTEWENAQEELILLEKQL